MTRPACAALAALALLAPRAARAASPRGDVVELKLGGYKPAIDSEAGLSGTPYATTFDNKNILLFQAEYEHQLYQGFGSFALGLSAGYGEIYGHGKYATGPLVGQDSGDLTALKVYPLALLAVYRFDYAAQRWDVPLVPFAKLGLDYQFYRVTNGTGDVAVDSQGKQGEGGRLGWEFSLGLAFMLDFLDPPLARDFDMDVGINHSYLFAEWRHAQIDGFGRPGLVFSDQMWTFGLALEFSPLTLALLLSSGCAHHLALQPTTELHGLAGVPLAFGLPQEKVPEGTQVHWSFGDGQEADGATARHTFARAGTFTVIEKVTDADGVRSAQVPVVVERRSPWMAVPPNAQSAVVFDRFFNHVGALRAFLSHLSSPQKTEGLFDQLQAGLGIDVRSPDAVRAAGLDPDEGLAWVTFPEEQHTGYLLVGTYDAARAEAALRQALTNAGATLSTTPEGWSVATAATTQVHFKTERGYLVIRVPGEGEPEPPLALGHFAQAPDVGMLSETAFVDARSKVTGDDVQAYFSRSAVVPPGSKPPASPRAGRLLEHLQRVVAAATLHEGELTAEALVQEDAPGTTAAAELFAGGGTPALPSTAPAGAAAYLGFSGDVPYLMELFAGLPAAGTTKRAELGKTLGAHGLDLDRLLALFAGEGAAAAYFDPAEFYRSLVETEVPLPRGDVLVQTRVRDPAAASQAVEKILAEGKAQPGRRELPGGGTRLEFTVEGHPAGAAVVRDQLVLSYGLRHLDDLLEPKAGAPRLEPALRANLPVGALGPNRLVLFLDLARVIAQLDETVAVPGLAPQDFFRARLMTGMAVAQFASLRDLTATLAPDPAGLRATFRLRLR